MNPSWLGSGRILFLTEDPEAVRRQLSGEVLPVSERAPLAVGVSTDEMTPAWACYHYDDRLGDYCLVGFRGGSVEPNAVRRGGFSVLVGGASFGSGSSRETAPFSQRVVGIRLVIAASFERIYRQNCHNLGIFTSTDLGLVERLERGETPTIAELIEPLDPITQAILEAGGLGAYGRERRLKQRPAPALRRSKRPLTLGEKILAVHAVTDAALAGVVAVAPSDVLFARADVRFSHEYVTAMIDAQFRGLFGESARVEQPETVFLFRDHLTLLGKVMPERHRRLGLLSRAEELVTVQRAFAMRHGIRLFDGGASENSDGICHNLVIEQLAKPGDIVVGTDSHTCMAGVLGCLAFGVGATEMAAGFYTGDYRVSVPETVKVVLRGVLEAHATAKDVWLTLLARSDVKNGLFRGRVIEFGGDGYYSLALDERATLTNMAAEAGAFTAIADPDTVVFEFIARERGTPIEGLRARAMYADPDAVYAETLELRLEHVVPMVALPGDPHNSIPLSELEQHAGGRVRIDIAYGGSCTGGKRTDMDMYAQVLEQALARGERVAEGVELYIQFGSRAIHGYALERGYLDVFQRAGATLLEPACGACIGAGPGVSQNAEQVTVSAINRNFPGRSGPGRVYLASPRVVAASAVAGYVVLPDLNP